MVQMEKAATDKRIRGASAACRTLVSLCVIPKSQACCTPGPLALCTVNSNLSLTATQCQSVGQRRMSMLPAHEHTRSCARSRHWTDQSSSHGRHPYRGSTRGDAYAMWWLVQVLQLSRLSCCACLYVHLLRVGWLTSQPAPRRPSPISSLGQRAHSNRLSVAVLLGPRLVVVNHHEPRASCGDSCHALCQAIFAARGFRAHCDNLPR